MATVLIIFKKNGEYLRKKLLPQKQSSECSSHDTFLGILDTTAAISFALGVIFSTVLAVSVALNSYSQYKVKIMAEKSQQSENTTLRESFNQAPLEKKSFNQAPIVPVQKPVETNSTSTTKQDVKK